ncbi:branched-chain amino acid ABC transporter permease [Streptomyces collinus]|uniref:ABC transporter permease subunit n=1 Tax=Streptomyces collinus TaxID=42684 RepID=UPI003675EA28
MIEGLLSGLASGGAFAILGLLLTVMYRLTATANLAIGATGAIGVYTMAALVETGWAYGLAAIAGVAAAASMSVVCGLIMTRWFAESGQQCRTAVSIAQLIGLLGLAYICFGDRPRNLPNPVEAKVTTLAGVVISQGTLVLIILALLLGLSSHFVLTRTALGLQLRAMAERPVTTELLGISTTTLTVGVWALVGALTALTLLLVAPVRSGDILSLTLLIVPACAAALIGGLRRLSATLLGGLGLGMLEGLLANLPWAGEYRGVVPFVVIVLILVWSHRGEVWDEAR